MRKEKPPADTTRALWQEGAGRVGYVTVLVRGTESTGDLAELQSQRHVFPRARMQVVFTEEGNK